MGSWLGDDNGTLYKGRESGLGTQISIQTIWASACGYKVLGRDLVALLGDFSTRGWTNQLMSSVLKRRADEQSKSKMECGFVLGQNPHDGYPFTSDNG
jgi:hypothetical protein